MDNNQQAPSGSSQQAKNDGKDGMDYGDKAFDYLSKKAGHQFDRKTSEKITDGARTLFEKLTGKKVSSKISN